MLNNQINQKINKIKENFKEIDENIFLEYFKYNIKNLIEELLKIENINEKNIFNILYNSYCIDFFVKNYEYDFINTLFKLKELNNKLKELTKEEIKILIYEFIDYYINFYKKEIIHFIKIYSINADDIYNFNNYISNETIDNINKRTNIYDKYKVIYIIFERIRIPIFLKYLFDNKLSYNNIFMIYNNIINLKKKYKEIPNKYFDEINFDDFYFYYIKDIINLIHNNTFIFEKKIFYDYYNFLFISSYSFNLKSITLSHCNINYIDNIFCNYIKNNNSLTYLKLDNNKLIDIDNLFDSLKYNSSIKYLILNHNKINNINNLGDMLKYNNSITYLDLSYNKIFDLKPLADNLNVNSSLTNLNISFNNITYIDDLFESLKSNIILTTLNIYGNDIFSIYTLNECIKVNSTLTNLNLTFYNYITKDDFLNFIDALKINKSLTYLYFKENLYNNVELKNIIDNLYLLNPKLSITYF